MKSVPVTILLVLTTAIFAGEATIAAHPLVIQAHRGFSSKYPENTMPAFHKAVEAGANRIEADLWMTADVIPIILHDRTLNRTTNGKGHAETLSLEQIQLLDAGSWMGESGKFAGTKVPTLNEVLDFIGKQNGVELNLEIKSRKKAEKKVSAAIAASVTLIKAKGLESSIVFSSFDLNALLQVRKLLPDARLILLDYKKDVASRGLQIARKHKLYGLSPNRRDLTAALVHDAQRAGTEIFVKGENQEGVREARRWGVAGFANDNPLLLKTWLGDDRVYGKRFIPQQSTNAPNSEVIQEKGKQDVAPNP
ncbi:MAG: glycerophosphodiester phosphodiesterase [Akkermansiaceae bacterium]